MLALYLNEFGSVSNLSLQEVPDPKSDDTMAVVKVIAASINPSDVKNVEGKMEHSTVPRIPGRDYAGIVVQGPAAWLGAEVWGTGGEIGYTIHGSHAEFLAVPVESLLRKPDHLSFSQAATIGVTYLAAWLGTVEYAKLERGETLLVIGAGGGVGGSAARVGKWLGARVIGVDRALPPPGASILNVVDEFVTLPPDELPSKIREITKGGASVVFDAVGGTMFEPALKCLAHGGRLTEISSLGSRRVEFDLIDFYHNESRVFGADTRHRNAIASKLLLEKIVPGFLTGAFEAPAIDEIIPLSDGIAAYSKLASGAARGRLVLAPDPNLA